MKDPHVPVLPNSNVGRRLSEEMVIHDLQSSPGIVEKRWPRQIERAIHNAMFIAQHIDNKDDYESVRHSTCIFLLAFQFYKIDNNDGDMNEGEDTNGDQIYGYRSFL